MINFNKRNINFISIIVTSIIFMIILFIIKNYTFNEISKVNNPINNMQDENVEIIRPSESNQNEYQDNIEEWFVKVPTLNINAKIAELDGLEPNIDAVGHIASSTIDGDNIALIAYNFGKEKNYFANLKELKVGDEIFYTINKETKKYKVIFNKIIEKQELENVIRKSENERGSYIKLFTYVIDFKDKIRYVYAKEVKSFAQIN